MKNPLKIGLHDSSPTISLSFCQAFSLGNAKEKALEPSSRADLIW
jgi:hypothetical protein